MPPAHSSLQKPLEQAPSPPARPAPRHSSIAHSDARPSSSQPRPDSHLLHAPILSALFLPCLQGRVPSGPGTQQSSGAEIRNPALRRTYLVTSWLGRDPESTVHWHSLHPWASSSRVGCKAMSDRREAGVVQGCSPGFPAGREEGAGSAALWGPHSRGTERWWGLLIHTHTSTASSLHAHRAAKQRSQNRGPHTQAGPALGTSLLSVTSLFSLAQREQDQCIS